MKAPSIRQLGLDLFGFRHAPLEGTASSNDFLAVTVMNYQVPHRSLGVAIQRRFRDRPVLIALMAFPILDRAGQVSILKRLVHELIAESDQRARTAG